MNRPEQTTRTKCRKKFSTFIEFTVFINLIFQANFVQSNSQISKKLTMESAPFNLDSSIKHKLFKLIGFDSDSQNGYIQVISQNSKDDFCQNFLHSAQESFKFPMIIYIDIFQLLKYIKLFKTRAEKERKLPSVTHWSSHKITSVFWLDKLNKNVDTSYYFEQLYGATRRGELIFLGQESLLQSFFKESSSIQDFKDRSGLSIDTGKFLTVPVVYKGKGSMEILEELRRIDYRIKRVNLRGRHIRVSGSKMPPYCDVRIENGKKIFSGTNYAVIHSASLKYNFTFSLDAPPKKSPGVKLKNGTWIGMLKDVKDGTADITIVNAYNVERFHVIDFTTVFSSTNLVYVTSHPKKEVSLAAISYPYTPFVWFLIICMFLLIIPAFFISFWFNPYSDPGPNGVNRNFYDILFNSIFIPYVLSVRQYIQVPHGLNSLSVVWMGFIIIIGIGYESNLVSYLSFPEPGQIPQNFEELANARQIGVPEYTVHFNIFSNIGRSLFRKGNSDMLKKMNAKFLTESPTIPCVIEAFASPHTACVGWDDILKSAIAKNLSLTTGIDPLFMSQHSLVNNWLAFGLRKDSQYTEAFGYIASSFAVAGLINVWKEEVMSSYRKIGQGWMSKLVEDSLYHKLKQLSGSDENPKPFQIQNVKISFYLFLFGLFMASAVFCAEIVTRNKSHIIHLHFGHQVTKKLLVDKALKLKLKRPHKSETVLPTPEFIKDYATFV